MIETALLGAQSLVWSVNDSEIQVVCFRSAQNQEFRTMQKMMNEFHKCEDVRDHVNELFGLPSAPQDSWVRAGRPVENVDEVSKHCMEAHDYVLTTHFASK